ncbi:MAG TPA: SgcJ/EcaC family oxidoreductase [Gemmataceae bacterium]|jgi:uncharacterized protein (TIGR02246 family)|nr:SgcJ/EcaC family oxidoreductase [Gemmataceae bacterium]
MKRSAVLLVAALGGTLAVGMIAAREQQAPKTPVPVALPARAADTEAITKSSLDFIAAFNKGDAKAVAALWTDEGECHDADGEVLQGRAAIEKAFAESFKDRTQGKLEVEIRSIRFPSRDTAIEEGFLRHTPDGRGLPSSTMYTASHVREDGKWLLAYSREYGAGVDRLGDLAFLIGKWEGGPKGQEASIIFEKDATGPFILGKFTRKTGEKTTITGTVKIGLDGGRGQIRSWHFDADGGHGQCLWIRDGNRWMLDAVGATGNGTETGAINVLARLSNNEITWRSIDRVVGGEPLPDTIPVNLKRVMADK